MCTAQLLVPDAVNFQHCGDEPASFHFGIVDRHTDCSKVFRLVESSQVSCLGCLVQAMGKMTEEQVATVRNHKESVNALIPNECGIVSVQGEQKSPCSFFGEGPVFEPAGVLELTPEKRAYMYRSITV